LMTLQGTVAKGQMPASQMLHSGALFISGLLFLVPSFATRVLGLVLFLPGLRHIAVWRFKIFMAQQAAKGAANWQGFRFYRYGPQGMEDFSETRAEREVHPTEVLDVTPLEITHERKRSENPE
ncbi:MAG: FxsA family protein, partial [Bdellovibrio sp.]